MQPELPPDQFPPAPDDATEEPGDDLDRPPVATHDDDAGETDDARFLADVSDPAEPADLGKPADLGEPGTFGGPGDLGDPGSSGSAGDAGPPPPPPPAAGSGPEGPGDGGHWAPSFKVLRSQQDRKLGGVAGGLAAAADLDPTIVRLGIVLGCLTGWGILAYLIAWAVIPEEDPAKGRYLVPAPEPTGKHLRIGLAVVAGLGVLHVLGTILGVVSSALIGLGLFPARLFGFRHDAGFDGGEALLGLVLLIGGCLLLFRRHLPWAPMPDTGSGSGSWFGRSGGPGPSGAGPSGSWAPPTPTGMALATIAPGSGGGGATAGGYGPPSADPAGMAGLGARASAAARAARTNGPLLVVRAAGWLIGLWFLAAAVIGGVLWASGALDVSLPVIPVVTVVAALGALGFALVRSRRLGVVIGAMALLLVPSALAAALTRVDGQAGDRSVSPTVVTDLDREYRHALGVLQLDLSRLQLPAGRTDLRISMGAGKAEVTVPWDTNVEASAEVSAGSFDLFGSRQTGVNLDGKSRSTGQPGAPLLVITGRAGAGEIIVRRGYEPFTQQALRTGQPVPLQCNPTGSAYPYSGVVGPLRCTAADGVTQTPALACVVAEHGGALCRPPGEPEPAVDFGDDAGTRRCQVPAGGGEATCGPPIAGSFRNPGQGTFTCSIPYGGGPAICRPGSGTDPETSPTPTPPAAPAPPDDPETTATTTATTTPPAAPGEYLCTVPEGGGPATCQPA